MDTQEKLDLCGAILGLGAIGVILLPAHNSLELFWGSAVIALAGILAGTLMVMKYDPIADPLP